MADRITGRSLQRIRRQFRAIDPLCARCKEKGKVVVWTQLDHIVALENGGVDSSDPFENRQGLCDDHHVEKTRADNGFGPSGGCSADGWPTDPRHPWNAP